MGRTFSALASVRSLDEKLDIVIQWMATIVPHISTLSFAVAVIDDRFSELDKKSIYWHPVSLQWRQELQLPQVFLHPLQDLGLPPELRQASMMKTCVAPLFYGFVEK